MILNPSKVKVWIVNAVPDPDLEGGGGGGGHPDPEIIRGSRPPQVPPLDPPLLYTGVGCSCC